MLSTRQGLETRMQALLAVTVGLGLRLIRIYGHSDRILAAVRVNEGIETLALNGRGLSPFLQGALEA